MFVNIYNVYMLTWHHTHVFTLNPLDLSSCWYGIFFLFSLVFSLLVSSLRVSSRRAAAWLGLACCWLHPSAPYVPYAGYISPPNANLFKITPAAAIVCLATFFRGFCHIDKGGGACSVCFAITLRLCNRASGWPTRAPLIEPGEEVGGHTAPSREVRGPQK